MGGAYSTITTTRNQSPLSLATQRHSSSEENLRSRPSLEYRTAKLPFQDEEKYRTAARANMAEAWRVLNHPSWKLAKSQNDDSIYSMIYRRKSNSKEQKIFKIVARVDQNAKLLKDDLWSNVDQIPEWDTALLESHKVCQLDEHTDITYQVTSASTTGLVTSRDFVNLRSWDLIEGYYIIAHNATEYPTLPKGQKYIRAENGVSCVALQIDPDDMTKCLMHFVINTSLKGWIPQYLLDAAIVDVLFKYVANLRSHIAEVTGMLQNYQPKQRRSLD